MKTLKILIVILVISSGLISCSHKIQFNTQIQGKPELNSIKRFAIGEIKVVQVNELVLRDRKGDWSVREQKLNTDGFEELIKKSLISNLDKFSGYDLIDLEQFRAVYSDNLKSIRPASGFKIIGIDAVMNLNVSFNVTDQEGSFDSVKTFYQSASSKQGKKWVQTQNSSNQSIVVQPYQIRAVTATIHVEIIKVENGNIKQVGSFSDAFVISLGTGLVPNSFSQEPKGEFMSFLSGDDSSKDEKVINQPFYKLNHEVGSSTPGSGDNLASRLGIGITNKILPYIGRYTVRVTRTIDTGGDDVSVEFLKTGKIEEAKKRIESLLGNEEQKTAENIYNLGICFEALGDSQIARMYYEEALAIDEGNGNLIEALGALENPSI